MIFGIFIYIQISLVLISNKNFVSFMLVCAISISEIFQKQSEDLKSTFVPFVVLFLLHQFLRYLKKKEVGTG